MATGLYVELLGRHEIVADALVYNTSSVWVYKSRFQGVECATKVILLCPNMNWQKLQSECEIMKALEHPHILKILHFFWEQVNTGWYLCIVTQWKAKDLWKDIGQRHKERLPYTEWEMWTHLRRTVSALAYLQRMSIAHRDIKPQNIFVSQDGLIIGDFGSARQFQQEVAELTLVGTPFFLSPKLKEALLSQKAECLHDPFKSDVYSLGLTFLAMMQLEPPTSLISSPGRESEQLGTLLAQLHYSDGLKDWVKLMCAHNEEDRCDFLFADQILNPPVRTEIPVESGESLRISADGSTEISQETETEEAKHEESPGQNGDIPQGDVENKEFEQLDSVSKEEIKDQCTYCSRECPPDDRVTVGKLQFCRLDCLLKTLHLRRQQQTWIDYFWRLISMR